jgi:hypothetical protein
VGKPMLYLILYTIFFFVTSIIYIILYGSKKQEFPLFGEKFHKIPNIYIRLLKIIPTLLTILFVIMNAPAFDTFFILVLIAFVFTFLGDAGMIINEFVGLALYIFTHVLLATAYITEIIQYSPKAIGQNSLISAGVILYPVTIFLFSYFMFEKIKVKYSKPKLVLFAGSSYLGFLFFNITTSLVLVFYTFSSSKGIISITIGAFLYLISDILIFVREASHKQKYSVLMIMSTYYLALYCISLVAQFYST